MRGMKGPNQKIAMEQSFRMRVMGVNSKIDSKKIYNQCYFVQCLEFQKR